MWVTIDLSNDPRYPTWNVPFEIPDGATTCEGRRWTERDGTRQPRVFVLTDASVNIDGRPCRIMRSRRVLEREAQERAEKLERRWGGPKRKKRP